MCGRERERGGAWDVIFSMQTTVVFTLKVARCLSCAQLGQDKELGVTMVHQDPNKRVYFPVGTFVLLNIALDHL